MIDIEKLQLYSDIKLLILKYWELRDPGKYDDFIRELTNLLVI